jgi:tRNA nucleotidyltransferase/poly(A) polymerase
MRELAQELLASEEAYVVGGAVRDALLGRPILDLDIACRDPQGASRLYAKRSGGALFPLSDRHGAWRVVLDGGATVDFTPLPGTIEEDLATRDFAANAIAEPLAGGDPVDPHGGRDDIAARRLRAVSATIFSDDPLRLLRAVRLEDELGFTIDPTTEELVREEAHRAAESAGERILAELLRLSWAGYRRLEELGLLSHLGGSTEAFARLDESIADSRELRLVAALGEAVFALPISNEQRRLAVKVLLARPPAGKDARAIHRFRRETEPYALEALGYLGARGFKQAVQKARANDPAEPLLRGDELGLPPGPQIGKLLERIEEERAAGEISTREQALALVRELTC